MYIVYSHIFICIYDSVHDACANNSSLTICTIYERFKNKHCTLSIKITCKTMNEDFTV